MSNDKNQRPFLSPDDSNWQGTVKIPVTQKSLEGNITLEGLNALKAAAQMVGSPDIARIRGTLGSPDNIPYDNTAPAPTGPNVKPNVNQR